MWCPWRHPVTGGSSHWNSSWKTPNLAGLNLVNWFLACFVPQFFGMNDDSQSQSDGRLYWSMASSRNINGLSPDVYSSGFPCKPSSPECQKTCVDQCTCAACLILRFSSLRVPSDDVWAEEQAKPFFEVVRAITRTHLWDKVDLNLVMSIDRSSFQDTSNDCPFGKRGRSSQAEGEGLDLKWNFWILKWSSYVLCFKYSTSKASQTKHHNNTCTEIRKETKHLRSAANGYYQTFIKLNADRFGYSISRPRVYIIMIRKCLDTTLRSTFQTYVILAAPHTLDGRLLNQLLRCMKTLSTVRIGSPNPLVQDFFHQFVV